ncbi:hypothetical protein MMC19_004118 [Ptychographa xylographoides]|nr:hypothetical protein [Ptychographa xylographoides]
MLFLYSSDNSLSATSPCKKSPFLESLQLLRAAYSSKIYFDGYLPIQKRPTRVSRLETYLKQVIMFQARHIKLQVRNDGRRPLPFAAEDLFDCSRSVPPRSRGFPATPFLVPAVLDSLGTSEYAEIVNVVPAEADSFCAAAASHLGGAILTSDSDLLVYDLGSGGSVIFFGHLELKGCNETPKHRLLKARVAIPSEISRRLGVTNLCRLAFELREDPSATLLEVARRAQRDIDAVSKNGDYKLFLKEYAEHRTAEEESNGDHLGVKSMPIRQLDPRLSELVLQSQNERPVHVYLPFLIEDPSRVSAWDASLNIRSLAYSLEAECVSRCLRSSVLEYRRRDHRIVPTDVQLSGNAATHNLAEVLRKRIKAINYRYNTLSAAMIWRIFAVIQVMVWHIETERTLPSLEAFIRAFCGKNTAFISWQDIQLSAQIQAALYSARILKQVVANEGSTRVETSHLEFLELSSVLKDLPSLRELIPSRLELQNSIIQDLEIGTLFDFVKSSARMTRFPEETDKLSSVTTSLESETSSATVKPKPKTRKRRRRKSMENRTSVTSSVAQTGNIYGVLAEV